MNKKGQALVEFLLIIPVLMFIILGIIDTGNIVTSKYKLEDEMSNIVNLYKNNSLSEINSYVNLNDLEFNYVKNNNYVTIKVSKYVSIITPGLNNILGKRMKIESTRVIYDE